jgi:hypothetical protein
MKTGLRKNVETMYLKTRKPEEPPTFAEYEAKLGTNELARSWQAFYGLDARLKDGPVYLQHALGYRRVHQSQT